MRKGISFFFPAFNDQGTVERTVFDAISVLKELTDKYEIIIVDDGSTDQTGKVAEEMAAKFSEVRVIHHPYNIGYGAALKSGFRTSKYELIFYTDGDHQYDPSELKKLIPLINEADIVSGYKIKRADPPIRIFAGFLYNLAIRIFLGLNIKDIDTAFKLIKKEVLESINLKLNGGFLCAELLYKAIANGYKIKQVPVSHFPRTYGRSSAFKSFFVLRSILEILDLWLEVVITPYFYKLRKSIMMFKMKGRKK